jgi:peptidoglycan/LPS O-acetylase OafA/YrhL
MFQLVKLKRFKSLDIVRGLAALSVLLTHLGPWTFAYADTTTQLFVLIYQKVFHFAFGYGSGVNPAVIIFIVLSGFCIHLPQALSQDNVFNYKFWRTYAFRRSIRILPVFFVGLCLGTVAIAVQGTKIAFDPNSQTISLELAFSFLGISEIARFFGAVDLYPGNGPLSTVAVEILLYATYPLIFLIFKKLGIFALLCFALLNYFGVALARLFEFYPFSLTGNYFEFIGYWIIGVISAEVYGKNHLFEPAVLYKWKLFLVFGYFCFLLLNTLAPFRGLHILTTLMLAILTGALLITMLIFENNKIKHSKTFQFSSVLGARSYTLYAVHTPIVFLMLQYNNAFTIFTTSFFPFLTLIIVLMATEFIYRMVERPSQEYAKRYRLAT